MPTGYQVTWLTVTFVMHNVYATIKIMVSYLTVTILYILSYFDKYYEKTLRVIYSYQVCNAQCECI